jgi:hypothetical protein
MQKFLAIPLGEVCETCRRSLNILRNTLVAMATPILSLWAHRCDRGTLTLTLTFINGKTIQTHCTQIVFEGLTGCVRERKMYQKTDQQLYQILSNIG